MRQTPDVLDMIPEAATKILDLGCAIGTNKRLIKNQMQREITSVKSDKVDKDAERMDPAFMPGYFDCIILTDVLERLNYPSEVLRKYSKYANNDGVFVISISNAKNIRHILDFIFSSEWRYESPGIIYNWHEHLRFFTLKSSKHIIEKAFLEPILKKRIFSTKWSRHINSLTLGILKDMLATQYIFVAKKYE